VLLLSILISLGGPSAIGLIGGKLRKAGLKAGKR